MASPTPGCAALGDTASAHRLEPPAGSPQASQWSMPMATPITSPVARSSASTCSMWRSVRCSQAMAGSSGTMRRSR